MNIELVIVKQESPAGFTAPGGSEALEVSTLLTRGMLLDRAATNKLVNRLEALESDAAGCKIMIAQLRAVLARKDWLRISVVADPSTVKTSGVNIGIAEAKATKQPKPRLSPMQKWQRRNGLGRRVL